MQNEFWPERNGKLMPRAITGLTLSICCSGYWARKLARLRDTSRVQA
jgi:hypothetical protein